MLAEAAVGEVLLFFSVEVGMTITDSSGRAFVPGLLPWQKNLIAIDPVDLPMDVQVNDTSQEVTPYARSGVVVGDPARRYQALFDRPIRHHPHHQGLVRGTGLCRGRDGDPAGLAR